MIPLTREQYRDLVLHTQDIDDLLDEVIALPPEPDDFWLYTPFRNYVVTSRFNAPRNYPFAPNKKQLHEGEDSVDGDAIGGDPLVYCGRRGKVAHVGFDARGYGKFLVMDFFNGWTCWYCHFANIFVSTGQIVLARMALGEMGATGMATGEHCHLTLCNPTAGLDGYVVAKVVNPAEYLRAW
jgi:murein DD-endopeptidase MepM/ murein hydrolase activator NlpD